MIDVGTLRGQYGPHVTGPKSPQNRAFTAVISWVGQKHRDSRD